MKLLQSIVATYSKALCSLSVTPAPDAANVEKIQYVWGRGIMRFLAATLLLTVQVMATYSAPAMAQGALVLKPADATQPVELYARSYALVIGIDTYANGWPKLSGARSDAKAVAKDLASHGFEVTLVADTDGPALRKAFEDFIYSKGQDAEARIFIWFAGHGHTLDGEGYLVPVDAPHPDNGAEFRRRSLSLRRFGEYMREIKSKHVLAVFDSCFAGTVFTTARALPPPAITLATGLPVRQFVSSGEAEQEVSDDGTFRKLFLGAINGHEPQADANRDGYLTGAELGFFLSDKITNLTDKKQTPRYGKLNALGLDRGDFVFQLKRLATPSPPLKREPADRATEAAGNWEQVRNSDDRDVLSAFADHYDGTFHARLAREKVERKKREALEAEQKDRKRAGAEARGSTGTELIESERSTTVVPPGTATGALLRTLEGHSGVVNAVKISRDGRTLVSGGEDKTVKLWDTATGRLLRTLQEHSKVVALAVAPNGATLVFGGQDGTIKLWDATTGSLLRTLEGHSEGVDALEVSPNSAILVSGGRDGTIKQWDLATGRLLWTFKATDWVLAVTISPDGRFVVGAGGVNRNSDHEIKIIESTTGKLLRTLKGHKHQVGSLAVSADGKKIVSGSLDETVRLWEASNSVLLRKISVQNRSAMHSVSSVLITPDGSKIVAGNGPTIESWQLATGRLLRSIEAHSDDVHTVALSPDGRWLASGGCDAITKNDCTRGDVKIWAVP